MDKFCCSMDVLGWCVVLTKCACVEAKWKSHGHINFHPSYVWHVQLTLDVAF
jgi:hypothetical protein